MLNDGQSKLWISFTDNQIEFYMNTVHFVESTSLINDLDMKLNDLLGGELLYDLPLLSDWPNDPVNVGDGGQLDGTV